MFSFLFASSFSEANIRGNGDYVEIISGTEQEFSFAPQTLIVFHNPSYFTISTKSETKTLNNEIVMINSTNEGSFTIKTKDSKNINCYFTIFNYKDMKCNTMDVYDGSSTNFKYLPSQSSNYSSKYGKNHCILFTSPNKLLYSFDLSFNDIIVTADDVTNKNLFNETSGKFTYTGKTIHLCISPQKTATFIDRGLVMQQTQIAEACSDPGLKFNEAMLTGYNSIVDPQMLSAGDYVEEIDSVKKVFTFKQKSLIIFHNPSYFKIKTYSPIVEYHDELVMINSTESGSFRVKSRNGQKQKCYFTVFRYGDIQCNTFDVYSGSNTNMIYNWNSTVNVTARSDNMNCILFTSPSKLSYPFSVDGKQRFNLDLYSLDIKELFSSNEQGSLNVEANSVFVRISTNYIYNKDGGIRLDNTQIIEAADPSYIYIEDIISGYNTFKDPYTLKAGDYVKTFDSVGESISVYKESLIIIHNPKYFEVEVRRGGNNVHVCEIGYINATVDSEVFIKVKENEERKCFFTIVNSHNLKPNIDIYSGSNIQFSMATELYNGNSTFKMFKRSTIILSSPNVLKYQFTENSVSAFDFYNADLTAISEEDMKKGVNLHTLVINAKDSIEWLEGRSDIVSSVVEDSTKGTDYIFNEQMITYTMNFNNDKALKAGDYAIEIPYEGITFITGFNATIIIHNPVYFKAFSDSKKYCGKNGSELILTKFDPSFTVKGIYSSTYTCYISVAWDRKIECDFVDYYSGSNASLIISRKISESNIAINNSYFHRCIVLSSPNKIEYNFEHIFSNISEYRAFIRLYEIDGSKINDISDEKLFTVTASTLIAKIDITDRTGDELLLKMKGIDKMIVKDGVNCSEKIIEHENRMLFKNEGYKQGSYIVEVGPMGKYFPIRYKSLMIIHNIGEFEIEGIDYGYGYDMRHIIEGTQREQILFIKTNFNRYVKMSFAIIDGNIASKSKTIDLFLGKYKKFGVDCLGTYNAELTTRDQRMLVIFSSPDLYKFTFNANELSYYTKYIVSNLENDHIMKSGEELTFQSKTAFMYVETERYIDCSPFGLKDVELIDKDAYISWSSNFEYLNNSYKRLYPGSEQQEYTGKDPYNGEGYPVDYEDESYVIYVATIVPIVIFVLLIAGVLIYCHKKKKQRNNEESTNEGDTSTFNASLIEKGKNDADFIPSYAPTPMQPNSDFNEANNPYAL